MLRLFWSLLVLLAALPGFTQTYQASGRTLIVNEVPVITLRTSVGKQSAEARVERLIASLRAAGSVWDVRSRTSGKNAVLLANGRLVLTVTPVEAAAAQSTPEALAAQWVRQLEEAIALPSIQVSNSYFRMPVTGSRTLTVVGESARTATVTVDNPSIVTVTRAGTTLVLKGLASGNAQVNLADGKNEVAITVEVRPMAAILPQTLSAEVTGVPATASTVEGAIESAVRNRLRALPGATWTLGPLAGNAIGPNQTRRFNVKVSVTAPEAFPAVGNVAVDVRNLGLSALADSELWYCNDPESVKFPQPLFAAKLPNGKAARMLYHHVNDSTQTMFVRVQLVNESDVDARIVIVPGDSAPDKNPVLAGIQAAEQYVRGWMFLSGEVITVPGQSSLPISLRRIAPGETMSGLVSLRLLEGPGDLLVRTDAVPPFALNGKWSAALRSSTPWRETGTLPLTDLDLSRYEISAHVYPNPYKSQDEWRYRVGDRHTFIRIGERAISRADDGKLLEGNFGVFYRLSATLSNPTSTAALVDIQFIPSAGYSGALFVIDGNLIRTPLLQPQSAWRVTRVRLEPGQTRIVRLTTIPLSGSSYPATLQIGAAGSIETATNGRTK